jgi:hypothetical protein
MLPTISLEVRMVRRKVVKEFIKYGDFKFNLTDLFEILY